MKKKIIIHSNHSKAKTGFGKHMKHLLTYLYKTNKYEIVEFSNGRQWNDPVLSMLPWKAFGSLPNDPSVIQECNANPQKGRLASYGHMKIDDIIKQEKPDIYLGIEDIWGLENFWKRKWWKKINSLIWTPIDSLPFLDKHIDAARNTENLIVQASFAKNSFNEQGFNNVHLLPVPLDTKNFFKHSSSKKSEIRSAHGINDNDFIIGFVFRNQLRKSVPNLLEGFKVFKKDNPDISAKLLLHTHWGEGWDIVKLIKEKSIDPNDVLTTYFCASCKQYHIKPFSGQKLDCPMCGAKGTLETAQINRGVTESQLNEIYNMMDVYCHPFTSGGQEIPIQEAKLCELITLVTNYSCGEDYSGEESGGMPLRWTEYREPGTQFIKASTDSLDIAKKLKEVYEMPAKNVKKMGKKAREYVIDFCSIQSVCSEFEKIIESMPKSDWDFDFSYVEKNSSYQPKEIESNEDWVIDLYKNILKSEDPEKSDEEGVKHWVHRLNTDLNRQQVYEYFVKIANEDNVKNQSIPFEDLLSKDDDGKRILFALQGNEIDVFNSTSLLKYIKDQYPDNNIYYATDKENENVLMGNPYIHKVIPYNSIMDNFIWAEGQGNYNGMFNFVLIPNTNTDKIKNYIHGNLHKPIYELSYA